jgi:predicted exporter
MTSRGWVLLAAWCGLLVLGVAWVQHRLVISADLRLFMPEPRTEEQRLLVQNIGESPASRLLLVAIGGEEPAVLAQISKQLAHALETHSEFGLVTNGGQPRLAVLDDLLTYRYLITDSFDAQPLDERRLADELGERAADMASPAAGLLEEWLPHDPTLEALRIANRWQPGFEPRLVDDAWFSANGSHALLMVETHAAAFDPDGQTRALDVLHAEFERARGVWHANLEVSGTGYFSSIIKNRTQREAAWFGGAATLGLVVLMWFAYRHLGFTLLGALPLASAALAGLAAVSAIFTSVHGITLAFGFTLIGVAQDYPIHLFSHLEPGKAAVHTARRVWQPLATGVASTCIAYLAFLVSGVTGLAQLACLTVTGLAVAGLTTRFLLPHVVPAPRRDPAASALLGRLVSRIGQLPRPLVLLALIPAAAAAILLWRSHGFWQNDLSKLTPVPGDLLSKDMELRRELATPDLRYLLVASGDSEQAVLQVLEGLDPALAASVQDEALGSYEHAARYLPSEARQRARQAALPEADDLRSMLRTVLSDLPFTDGLFEPFIDDIRQAKRLLPLTHADFQDGTLAPLGTLVNDLLFERHGRWYGLVNLFEVQDPAAVARSASDLQGTVTFLDLKAASEALVATQRSHIVFCLGIAAASLIVVIWIALRRVSRVMRVLAPMVLTTLVILAVLRACDVSLNLFHLISLVLAAGLGLDYSLFFEHAASDPPDQKRTLHALLVCSISTLLVFALLALSTVPVLQAIGVTVSLGVVSNFVLALLLTRERVRA